MRRFVRIKRPPERPQAALVESAGVVYRPIMLHATIDQDRAVGSRLTFSEHVHDFYHVVLYTGGRGWYSKEGRFLPAVPGTCVLIEPGQRHEFVTRRQSAVYSELTFSYETDSQRTLKIPFAQLLSLYSGMDLGMQQSNMLSPENRQTLYNMMAQTVDYLNSSRPSSGYYVHRTLAHILDFLIEHCTEKPIAADVDDRFSRVRLWLEQHYLEPVTMDELAQMAGVAKSYFFRAFKKAFGMPPLTYQQMLRIEAAKTLLRATSLNCGEVAFRAGFTDVFFFHRVFKKHTGQTPKQFRRLSS